MAIAPAIAIATAFATASFAPVALVPAIPILLLWLVSPGIAWWISRPLARREVRLTTDQLLFLRKLARRTWAFFETFVGPDDHWLPPDNWQEHPVATVAHRTSPTNMGFALLGHALAAAAVRRLSHALARAKVDPALAARWREEPSPARLSRNDAHTLPHAICRNYITFVQHLPSAFSK